MDKEIVDIPSTVHLGQATSNGEDIPEAFAQYFKDKVQNISNSTTIDEEVFNGSKQEAIPEKGGSLKKYVVVCMLRV